MAVHDCPQRSALQGAADAQRSNRHAGYQGASAEPDGVGCLLLPDLPDALAGLLPVSLLQRAGPAILIVVQQREAFPRQYKQGTVGYDEAVHPSAPRDRRHSPTPARLLARSRSDA